MRKFFILCLISNHPRAWVFVYFTAWSAVILKYGEIFLGETQETSGFRALQVPSWNIRKNFLEKSLGQKSFISRNIRNFSSSESFLLICFNLGVRKFHFPKYKKKLFLRKYKKFFQSGIFLFFLFFELGMKSAPGSCIYNCY